MMATLINLIFLFLVVTSSSAYNMLFDNPRSQCENPKIGSAPKCIKHYRNVDGYCTNSNPAFRRSGTVDSAQFRIVSRSNPRFTTPPGLRSARTISSIISAHNPNNPSPSSADLTDFATFFGQFLDHCIVLTGEDANKVNPIKIEDSNDPALKEIEFRGGLPFKRSRLACGTTRPINCLSSAIDLSAVYGSKLMRLLRLRTGTDGLMKTTVQNGQHYPPRYVYEKDVTDMVIPNQRNGDDHKARSHTEQFYFVGDGRGNENKILTAFHVLFLREHNRLAAAVRFFVPRSEIMKQFKDYDEGLFQLAKRLNEAAFQSIVVNEYVRFMTGSPLPKIKKNRKSDPSVSDAFAGAGFRVGHSMLGQRIYLKSASGVTSRQDIMQDMFFTDASTFEYLGVDDILRGITWHKADNIDMIVNEALRNFLFKQVPGETTLRDLLALNLQRSRDHNVASYVELCRYLGEPVPRSFADISSDRGVADRLSRAYNGRVDLVEAWPGLMAQDRGRGKPMGRTLAKLWHNEFSRLLSADRFLFSRKKYHPLLKKHMSKEVNDIRRGRRKMKDIIKDNTGITDSQLPPIVWQNSRAQFP